jgi:hypothetical protein
MVLAFLAPGLLAVVALVALGVGRALALDADVVSRVGLLGAAACATLALGAPHHLGLGLLLRVALEALVVAHTGTGTAVALLAPSSTEHGLALGRQGLLAGDTLPALAGAGVAEERVSVHMALEDVPATPFTILVLELLVGEGALDAHHGVLIRLGSGNLATVDTWSGLVFGRCRLHDADGA